MKKLKVVKVPQLAPKVALKWEWRDEKNRRCSQFISLEGIEEREGIDIVNAVNQVIEEMVDKAKHETAAYYVNMIEESGKQII